MTLAAYSPTPLLELRRPPERTGLVDALAALDARLPMRVPVLIGRDERMGDGIRSHDPATPDRVVAVAPRGTADDVAHAVAVAAAALPAWAARPMAERAGLLLAAADLLRARRRELVAIQVRECGKPWVEADADVAEAADHLAYAAHRGLLLADGAPLLQIDGERNTLRYRPRGVVAAIGPWNFPLAIPAGLVAGPLVTGNTVVLKPAEQAPGSAVMLVMALREAGVPAEVLNLVTGDGATGAALVAHPQVATIAFTGSEAVGLGIIQAAASTSDAKRHVTRVVAEMGGKNAIIVDSDADLDETIPDLVRSAFSYAGQKCSAASRVLVHRAIADELERRLAGAVACLRVGPADDFATDVPALIDRDAHRRVGDANARGATEGRIAAQQPDVPAQGWFQPPTVVSDLPESSTLTREEIFGPVLTLERVRDIDHALDLVEASRFALTGGLFTRNPRTVRRVVDRSPVGNLYVNRAITGAVVGRQPFGGNRRSGIGAKVGGPDFLLQFVDAQVVCENTMRHGLPAEADVGDAATVR
jgi:RHH-type transcriptional regulator, proline utilization regulon repressor / proline dehydrogenase / delta 1-pyrroline-5-carboxylate dehydrogenase